MDLFTLFGKIVTNSDEATKDIDKVTEKAKEADKGISKSFDNAGGSVNAFNKVGIGLLAGATAIYGGVTALGAKLVDNAGEIKDSADRAGMAAEEFQKWTFAAEQSGMSMESLQSAMVKQQRSFADAKSGNASMAESYQKLGLDISSIGSSSEAFDQVMAKLGDMDDETTRNALAADIFGKSYAELTPLLNEGSTGMANLKQTAVELGAVMSNETVAAGEELGDKLDQVKAAGGGLLNTLGEVALPQLTKFANWFIEKAPEIEAKAKPVFDGIASSIDWVVQNSNWLIPVIVGVVAAFAGMQIVGVINGLMTAYSAFTQGATLAQAILNAVMAANPIMLVVLAIAALIAIGVALVMNWDKVKAFFIGFFDKIKEVFDKIKDVMSEPFRKAAEIIKGIFEGLVNTVKAPINAIIDAVNRAFASVGSITIPKWVPGIGGASFSLPQIPRLKVGMDYVPYDFYPAYLDKGERVLTAAENKAYNSGFGPSTVNVYVDLDGYTIVKAIGQPLAEYIRIKTGLA